MIDYNGLFGDLVDMWSRAVSTANESDDSGFNRRCLSFASECLRLERDVHMQMLREIAREAA